MLQSSLPHDFARDQSIGFRNLKIWLLMGYPFGGAILELQALGLLSRANLT